MTRTQLGDIFPHWKDFAVSCVPSAWEGRAEASSSLVRAGWRRKRPPPSQTMSHLRVFPAASAPALPAPARFCLLTASPTPAAPPESRLPPSSCTAESGSAPGTVPTSPGSISRLQGRGRGCSWHRPRGTRLCLPVGRELGTPAVARRSWWLLPQQCWLPGCAGGRCGITGRGGILQDRKCGKAAKEEPGKLRNTSDSPATNGLSFRGLSKSSPCLQPSRRCRDEHKLQACCLLGPSRAGALGFGRWGSSGPPSHGWGG